MIILLLYVEGEKEDHARKRRKGVCRMMQYLHKYWVGTDLTSQKIVTSLSPETENNANIAILASQHWLYHDTEMNIRWKKSVRSVCMHDRSFNVMRSLARMAAMTMFLQRFTIFHFSLIIQIIIIL